MLRVVLLSNAVCALPSLDVSGQRSGGAGEQAAVSLQFDALFFLQVLDDHRQDYTISSEVVIGENCR